MKPELLSDLIREAEAAAVRSGIELLDVSLRGSGRAPTVCVVADKPGGITVEDCAAIHRSLRSCIEQAGPGARDWRIEVSSPGLDRPLKTERDFRLQTGRKIRIEWTRDGAPRQDEGIVRAVADGAVALEFDGQTVRIPLTAVIRARRPVQW
ncbi:ribosome maturation factor RimP [bacterium]|nr:ribosome maturation factor RimP [bacterium]